MVRGSGIFLFSLLFAGVSFAVEYYVDAACPYADDTSTGTLERPFLTIQHAADIAVAGDTVFVKPGTYNEHVAPANSGVRGKPIVFKSLPRRTALVQGFRTPGADYITIEGFNITNSLSAWDQKFGVFIRSDHVEVIDNYLYNIKSNAIQGDWGADVPEYACVARNEIYHCQSGIGITGLGWVVEKNEVRRLYQYGGGDCDYSRFFGDDHIIRENYFHGTNLIPAEIGTAHVDAFQTFDNNGEHARHIIVERNTCADFHQAFMGEAEFYYASYDITFRNNLFRDGGAWGLCVQEIAQIKAYNNTFVDIAYHGIGLGGSHSTGNIIRNNIFCNIETSYWTDTGATLTGDYNLVYNCAAPPVAGANDIIDSDPQFEDSATDIFTLKQASPARDAGDSLAEITEDHDGKPRPQGAAWDMGAYEWSNPDAPTCSVTYAEFSGTAVDASSINVMLWINGVRSVADAGGWTYELALDERRDLTLCAEDSAGNTRIVTVTVDVH